VALTTPTINEKKEGWEAAHHLLKPSTFCPKVKKSHQKREDGGRFTSEKDEGEALFLLGRAQPRLLKGVGLK